jgi:chaperonin GroES
MNETVGADERSAKGRAPARAVTATRASSISRADRLPVKMMHDRVLVQIDEDEADRRSSGGILIPATAQLGKRLTWGVVRGCGPSVRNLELEDHVLFNSEDSFEAEVAGEMFTILRERDVHAVAAERLQEGSTGLYL